MTRFIDLRLEQSNPLPPKMSTINGKKTKVNLCKKKNGKVVERDLSAITGICFHQTACVFGAPNKKDPESRYRRALDIPCHGVGFLDGVAVLPCPFSWFVYHGNGFNEDCLGLEFEGHFPGLLDDPTTPRREDLKSIWGKKTPTPLSDLAVQCYRDLTKRVVEEAREMGCPVKYAYAHRQSNGDKLSDPGEGIWKRVVLEYAVPVLGLETRPHETRRDGKEIPKQWDPAGRVRY